MPSRTEVQGRPRHTSGPRSAGSTVSPVSSHNSRAAASAYVSPSASPPPGANHRVAPSSVTEKSRIRSAGSTSSTRALRRTRSSITAAA